MINFDLYKNNSINYLNLFTPLIILILCVSCDNYLQESNKSSIATEDYFTNEEHAEQAIQGIYSSLGALLTGWESWTIDFPVGHATTSVTGAPRTILHQYDAFESQFEILWTEYYRGIANANLAIDKIPDISMDELKKKQLLGEAYFLRAWYYFYMVRLFGDIPLITEPINFASSNLYPERTDKKKIYDLIITDLEIAEESGLPEIDESGRVSLGAIKSLLSTVYLTMAGYPMNYGDEYYKLAADKAEEVLDADWYELFDKYLYLHDREHKNKGELIFQAQYQAGILTNDITERITPATIGISRLSDEWGQITPLKVFIESYEENDLRTKEKQFFFTNYNLRGTDKTVEFGEYALYKFWLEEAAGINGDGNGDINFTFIRLPEVMLNFAEASNEINGPSNKGYKMLNEIRERAEIPPLSKLSKEEFREAVWRERYHELCFEHKAYFDIQRTRKAFNLRSGKFEDVIGYQNESGVVFEERDLLWAIPAIQIDINPNLEQNKGW